MDNWLLIVIAVIFIICIVVGYVRGFLKLGLSLVIHCAYPCDCSAVLALCGRCAGGVHAH